MVNGTAAVLEPTYTGYVATTQDALILFEACLTGVLHHVPRRPHDRERSHLVRSGSIFIYEENSSGIKRWTDGVTWSPSRILGNFLVYRELDKPFPPGEKKRAMKKGTRRPVPPARPGEPYPRPESNGQTYSPTTPTAPPFGDRSQQSEVERALVGSLVDSYGFKDSGLVKKTMSVTVSGVTHHLVSYYSVEDVIKGVLSSPTMTDQLRFVRPRAELTSKQSFRAPIDDVDTGLENPNDPSQLYGYRHTLVAPPGYGMPSAHPDYYMHSAQYASHPSQPSSLSAYPSGPLPPHSASNPYLPAPSAASQLPPKADPDHAAYHRAPSYGGGYDSLSHHHLPTSIPPSLNTSSMPSGLSDRSRSQQTSSPTIYRNSSLSSRSIHTDATSPLDAATSANSYSRGSFGISGTLDAGSTPSLEQQHRNVASAPFDPTVPRRESNPLPPSYYTGGGDRPNYYVGSAHSNYPTAQPISTWTTTAPTQPQM